MYLFHKKYLGDTHRTPGDQEIWRRLSLITSGLQVRKYPKQLQKSYEPILPYVLPFSFEKILGASRLHSLAQLRITFYVFHVQRCYLLQLLFQENFD